MQNKYFVIYTKEGGQIIQGLELPHDTDTASIMVPPSGVLMEVDSQDKVREIHKWAVKGGKLVEVAHIDQSTAGKWQTFDMTTGALIDATDLADMIAETKAAIDTERAKRSVEYIALESPNARFDADNTAQTNVKGKLMEIEAAKALGTPITDPAMLVWRDYDNVMHAFSSQDEYEVFLHQITATIARRNTELYQWAWAAKDRVAAATGREQLLAIAKDLEVEL